LAVSNLYREVPFRMARLPYDMHGTGAIAESAQKVAPFERAGDEAQARLWRRVQSALLEIQDPKGPSRPE